MNLKKIKGSKVLKTSINVSQNIVGRGEIIHYYDDIIKPHQPAVIVIYCDINIEIGQHPKAVLTLYKTLLARIEQDFPQAQILLLSMKPTLVDHILGREVLNNKNITNQKRLQLRKKSRVIQTTTQGRHHKGSTAHAQFGLLRRVQHIWREESITVGVDKDADRITYHVRTIGLTLLTSK